MTIDKQTLCIENAFDIENQLYELANNEIECDSFAVTSTNENGTEIEFERPITDLALEAASTINALLKRLESKEKLVADTASQLDVQLARSNALAAENAGMKHAMAVTLEHVSVTDAGQAGVAAMIINDALHHSETPGTDTFLAEVRAQGVEMFAVHCQKRHGEMMKSEPNEAASNQAITATRHAGEFAMYFAAQLRKGAAL